MSATTHSPDVTRALDDIQAAKTGVAPAVADCLDLIANLVVQSGNPTAVFDRVVTALADAQWHKPTPAPAVDTALEGHGFNFDKDFGYYRTPPIQSAMRDADASSSNDTSNNLPFLEAEIVVIGWDLIEGRWQRVDRTTQMWVSYGTTTGELPPAKAREVAAEMRAFSDRLTALCDLADKIAADDERTEV